MDSITHVAFGALVGEAVLGRKVGNKALAWGAGAATVPDLDVVVRFLASEETYLLAHRAATHSLFFAPIVAPLLGWLVWTLYRRRGSPAAEAGWSGWGWLFFWGMFTHPLLDTLTVYGTQILWPFTLHPFAYPLLFIIDPAYTLPLIAAAIACLFLHRERALRRRLAWGAFGLSSLYLVWSFAVKQHVERVVREDLAEKNIAYERILTNPMPLQTILWNAAVDGGDSLYIGLYGLLDPDRDLAYHRLPREMERFAPYADTRAGRVLTWFSQGWNIARPDTAAAEGMAPIGVVLHDVRFGRTDGWLTDDGGYIFSFHLQRRPDGSVTFAQLYPTIEPVAIGPLWQRILGHRDITRPDVD